MNMKNASLTIWTTSLLLALLVLGISVNTQATHQLPTPVAHWTLDETVVPDPGPNLLANPGFETYTVSPGTPDDWSNLGGTATQLSRETAAIHEGSNALRITTDGTFNGAGVHQTFTGASGTAYQFQAFGKTNGAASEQAFLSIRFASTPSVGYTSSATRATETVYTNLGAAFISDGTSSMTFQLRSDGLTNGRVGLWDAASLTVTGLANNEVGSADLAWAPLGSGASSMVGKPGKVGTAYEFNGNGQRLSAGGTGTEHGFTGDFSVSAWVKADGCLHSYGGNQPTIATASNQWSIRLFSDGVNCFLRFVAVGPSPNLVTDDLAFPLNQWVHVAGVWDAPDMVLYQDGVEVARQATTGSLVAPAVNPIVVGGSSESVGGTPRFWDGLIDDVRLYNVALLADDVEDLYLSPEHGSRATTTASTTITTYPISGIFSHVFYANTTAVLIECVGGGGGGGGSSGSVTASAGGGGGGAGGYTRKYLNSPPARIEFTVGAGGAGGAAGNNAGTVGQNTVIVNPAMTCFGGSGGPGMAAGATATAVSGGAGGSSSGGELAGVGAAGGLGIRHDATFSIGGRGGASSLGAGGSERTTNGAGAAAAGVGGGGGGARSTDTAFAGGAGASGAVVIWEFTDETQGPQGEPGEDGEDGAQGPQGIQGPVGPEGPEGPVVCDDENCTIVQVEGMEFAGMTHQESWTLLLWIVAIVAGLKFGWYVVVPIAIAGAIDQFANIAHITFAGTVFWAIIGLVLQAIVNGWYRRSNPEEVSVGESEIG